MNDITLDQIGELIDRKLKPVSEKLEDLDLKIEAVNAKVDNVGQNLNKKIDNVASQLNERIDQLQKDVIDTVMVPLIDVNDDHDKRIKTIEDHLHLPQHS